MAVEEGWRFQDTFRLKIIYGSSITEVDETILSGIHGSMAETLSNAKIAYNSSDLPRANGRKFAVFRFTPVIKSKTHASGHQVLLGESVAISNLSIDESRSDMQLSLQGYELIFLSGFFKIGEDKTN